MAISSEWAGLPVSPTLPYLCVSKVCLMHPGQLPSTTLLVIHVEMLPLICWSCWDAATHLLVMFRCCHLLAGHVEMLPFTCWSCWDAATHLLVMLRCCHSLAGHVVMLPLTSYSCWDAATHLLVMLRCCWPRANTCTVPLSLTQAINRLSALMSILVDRSWYNVKDTDIKLHTTINII